MKLITYNLFLILSIFIGTQAAHAIRITHGPYLQDVSTNEISVVWVTDVPSVGWVETAPNDNESFYAVERPRTYDAPTGIKNTSTIHTVRLRGLQPNTTYRYRAYSQEVLDHKGHNVFYGTHASTNPYGDILTFRTANPDAPVTSFAMVNDIHGKNDLLKNLVAQCNLKTTDFFLFNGDMVSSFDNEEQIFTGFMDKATELFASRIPMYYTRGNHETRSTMATKFKQYFSPKAENIYYTFRQGPVFFVILDTGEDKPDTDIEYSDITDYDNYRSIQAEWLHGVLQSKEYQEAPFKIIVGHMPPENGWHGSRDLLAKFVPLLNEATPDLMLCGHLHEYENRKPNQQVRFPIVINSNNTILQAEASNNELKIRIVDESGKEIDKFTLKK